MSDGSGPSRDPSGQQGETREGAESKQSRSAQDRDVMNFEGDDDVSDEIRHHILERADALVRDGWTRRDAMREAERRFGNVAAIRKDMKGRRRFNGWETFRSIGSDFRHAVRGIGAQPTFSIALIATLALGIGAAVSIFATVDALLIRPLQYDQTDRLVELNRASLQNAGYTPGIETSRIHTWRESAADLFDGWIAWSHGSIARTDGEAAEPLEILAVTPGADTLLGLPLLHGRGFGEDDARVGGAEVAVLGRAYYERIGGDASILGSTIRLESGPVTVVGVLRGGVRFPTWGGEPDLWLPLRDDFTTADRSLGFVVGFWGRLRSGVSIEVAQERVDAIAAALQEREPLEEGWRLQLASIDEHRMSDDLSDELWTVAATVAAIFLIAWVNGINLLLVRASARTRELAVRLAIGGSRARVARQLVIEGIVWGCAGGAVALAFSVVGVGALDRMVPWIVKWSSPHALEVESRTLGFTFAATLLVGTVLGFVSALHVLKGRVVSPLARRPADDTVDRRKLRSGLVVVQVALSMTLLAGAGLFVKSFAQLVHVDPGYDYERIAIASIGLWPTRYPNAATRADFFQRLEERLEGDPGIEAVTRIDVRGFNSAPLEPEGGVVPREQPVRVPRATIAHDYLDVMGVDLVAGRGFITSDAGTGAVIVDLDLARFLWEGPAVGRRFRLGEDGEWLTVVGVVDDLRMMGRDQREGPYQILHPAAPNTAGSWVELAVRSRGDPASVLATVREAVRELDPEQSIWRLRPAKAVLADDEAEPRFVATLMSLLAGIAVTLAAVGLYGVLAYAVSRRGRELAVRIAIGADARAVRRMVVGEGLIVATVGVAFGLGGAVIASRQIEHLLYNVQPHDSTTLFTTALLFLAVAAMASYLPARRAVQLNPAETLRRD